MASLRLAGPWAQKFAKDLPEPAGGGWGDVDRATHRGYTTAQHFMATAPAKSFFMQSHSQAHSQQAIKNKQGSVERLPPASNAVSPVAGSTRQQLHKARAEKQEHENEVKLENKAAAIKAQMAKMLDSYGDAALKTSAGYQP